MLTNRRMLLTFLAVSSAVATGCGGDGDGSTAADHSISNLLTELPAIAVDGGTPIQIAYSDLERATELGGLTEPALDDTDAVIDWARIISNESDPASDAPALGALLPQAANPDMIAGVQEFDAEMGWSVLDIDAFVEFEAPPQNVAVIAGTMEASDIDGAAGRAEDGIWSVGDGDDFDVDLEATTAARPLGGPVRMAVQDDLLAVSRSTPPLRSWLDGDETFGDNETLMAVAEQLDAADVYAAYLIGADGGTGTNPYDAYGLGVSVVDDESAGVFVYHYADSDTAEGSVEAVQALFDGTSDQTQAPWSDVFSSWDVAAHDDTVVVTVGFTDNRPPAVMWQIMFTRDDLVS
jgi:hypothetical protein